MQGVYFYMKKILLVLFSLLTTFSLMTIQAEGGKELAQENCASCHGNPDLNLIRLKAMSYLNANDNADGTNNFLKVFVSSQKVR